MTKLSITVATIALLPAVFAHAQDGAEPEVAEVTIGEVGSEQDPLSGRDAGLAIEPERVKSPLPASKTVIPATRVKIDPRVLGVAPGESLPALRREGETLRKRDGRLLPTGERGYAVFILDADPQGGDEQPLAMVVAPCITLESMERLLEDRGENLRFTITGQVHTYRGVNYLLPTSQPKPWLIDAGGEQTLVVDQPADEDEPDDGASATEPDEREPAAAPPDEADPKETAGDSDTPTPSADDVLQQLLEQKREGPVADVADPAGDADDDPPAMPRLASDPLLLGLETDQPLAELKEEGQFIIARTGRLIRSADGSQSLFVLDADGPGAPEPPMILQACKLLETMERTVQEQGEKVPFVVTGQVFMYRGANYLLPTIVKREFDNGNLE
jgi:hypothetical protein